MEFLSRNDTFQSKSSKNVKPIGSLILDLPPSCIEFVPLPKADPDATESQFFVVGTYDLQKEDQDQVEPELDEETSVRKEQSRQGSLSLFKLNNDELIKIKTLPTPSAILDLHFFKDTSYFAVASSTGTISFYQVKTLHDGFNEGSPERDRGLLPICTHQVLGEEEIVTAFAWDEACQRQKPVMSITSTTGAVMVLRFNENFTEWEMLNDGEIISQHGFEAWCSVFSQKGETLFSGGDDSKLIMSSLSSPETPTRKLPFHNAGVTAILPIPFRPSTPESTEEDTTILLTGSYDDFVRVYLPPTRFNAKPAVLAEKDIGLGGGGVWRLKFLTDACLSSDSKQEEDKFLVLASCMRVGCKVLKITKSRDGTWGIQVLAQVGVHESMNYASDFMPVPWETTSRERTIVSTSFYDRLLFVWKFELD